MCVFYFITQNIKEKYNQGSRCNKMNQFLLHVTRTFLIGTGIFFPFFLFFFLNCKPVTMKDTTAPRQCHVTGLIPAKVLAV